MTSCAPPPLPGAGLARWWALLRSGGRLVLVVDRWKPAAG